MDPHHHFYTKASELRSWVYKTWAALLQNDLYTLASTSTLNSDCGFGLKSLCHVPMTDRKCEVVSKSLLKNSSNLPPEELKKFCLGLPEWCPCCKNDGMERCDDDSAPLQTRGKSLSLKRSRSKNSVPTKKTKDAERFFLMLVLTS